MALSSSWCYPCSIVASSYVQAIATIQLQLCAHHLKTDHFTSVLVCESYLILLFLTESCVGFNWQKGLGEELPCLRMDWGY